MLNEHKKLVDPLDDDLVSILTEHNAFIAGGAITSVMTNKPINDYDIYFRSKTEFTKVITEVMNLDQSGIISSSSLWMFNVTDKSLMFKSDGNLIQFICYRFFNNPDELFKSYDFTINMGAYDFARDDFEFHPDFFRHNAQRYLHFNPTTDYPLVSAMRVQKYKERGYTISKAQMLKILMTISDLEINSWNQFKDHVGGMYGLSVDDVFDTTQLFSKFEAIAQLDNLVIPDKMNNLESCTVNEAIEKLKDCLDHKVLADVAVEFKKENRYLPSWVSHIDIKYRPT